MFILYEVDYQLAAQQLASSLQLEAFSIANSDRKTLLAWAEKGELAILLDMNSFW